MQSQGNVPDSDCWLASQFIRHALLIGRSVYQTCPANWLVSLSDMRCWLACQFITHALLIGWSVYQTCPGHWPLLTARCPDLRLQTMSPLTIKEVIIIQFQHQLMMWDPSNHSCKNSNKRRGVLPLQIDKDSSAGRSSFTKNWIDQRHLR